MLCVPAESEAVAQEAVPAFNVTAAQPEMVAPPSRNSTVPVGVPAEREAVSVKVTVSAVSDGFFELPIVVDGVASGFAFTVCETLAVLGLYAVLPE